MRGVGVFHIATAVVTLVLVAAAPLDNQHETIEDSLKPLVRTKRAELVMFGNHQNHDQRVKKSSLPVLTDEAVIDSNGNVKTEKTVIQKEEIPDIINNGESTTNDAASKGDNVEDKTEDEEHEEKIITPEGETDKVTVTKVEHTKDGDIKETKTTETMEPPASDADFSGDEDNQMNLPKKWEDQDDYYYYDDNYYPYPGLFRRKRSAHGNKGDDRVERSAPVMMTAENMMTDGMPDPSTRVKRDLAADNIQYWLERGANANDYPDYENEMYDDGSDQRVQDLLAQYSLPYGGAGGEDPSLDYNSLYPLETEQEAEEEQQMEQTKDRLALLKYLMEEVPEREEEGTVEDLMDGVYPQQELYPERQALPDREVYPEDVVESWQDMGPEPEDPQVEYEPIVYQGVAGIFIPLQSDPQPRKRQYMSMVPGLRKRNFYPYNLEPEGGRWGAVVPQEDKRTAESYERLYQMAQALARGRNEDEGIDWRY